MTNVVPFPMHKVQKEEPTLFLDEFTNSTQYSGFEFNIDFEDDDLLCVSDFNPAELFFDTTQYTELETIMDQISDYLINEPDSREFILSQLRRIVENMQNKG